MFTAKTTGYLGSRKKLKPKMLDSYERISISASWYATDQI